MESDFPTIHTLGQLGVELEGEPVLATGSKQALLAAYLALERRSVSRDDLAVLFWPGRPRESALHSLRQMLWGLRRVFGEAVEAGNNHITLEVPDHTVDVRRMGLALADGRIGGEWHFKPNSHERWITGWQELQVVGKDGKQFQTMSLLTTGTGVQPNWPPAQHRLTAVLKQLCALHLTMT